MWGEDGAPLRTLDGTEEPHRGRGGQRTFQLERLVQEQEEGQRV